LPSWASAAELAGNVGPIGTARERAADILAQAPDVSSESIAKEVGVDRTSLSRWKKDPRFQKKVSQLREFLKQKLASKHERDKDGNS
jgi:hypothetical protein